MEHDSHDNEVDLDALDALRARDRDTRLRLLSAGAFSMDSNRYQHADVDSLYPDYRHGELVARWVLEEFLEVEETGDAEERTYLVRVSGWRSAVQVSVTAPDAYLARRDAFRFSPARGGRGVGFESDFALVDLALLVGDSDATSAAHQRSRAALNWLQVQVQAPDAPPDLRAEEGFIFSLGCFPPVELVQVRRTKEK